ncbi:uncharacterized protein BCR38DRAFT_486455 [Pseudomassariella vexata]|uniref:t-SNARE coiled-coil homology domain-containing protein n=1 Tax=Pseudomassariella vexata TaxID=1141098 RepID=A0A1Y2DSP8_9PEZI|nr:uncharacterized protein BCR38DRAFT_486455 [Pseudomassariella vexata]ORY62184.1 hypothetical protein BCR38DRAFT_486455 [Pseudomassariella vexata]
MKKFGFGSKKEKGGSPASSDNPYAQPQDANDPYAGGKPMTGPQAAYKQYQQAPIGGGLPSGPRGSGGLPGGPGAARGGYGASSLNRNGSTASSETAPPPYSNNQSAGGYVSDRYGAQGGYGSNRYEKSGGYSTDAGARGPGGYGGLGRTNSDDTDANRDALFAGAKDRYATRPPPGPSVPSTGSGGYGASGAASSYGGYGEQRELTAEEQEEAEVDDVKRQIKEMKLASANSAENSERIAAQAVETALGTYARLGAQHERLNYTESLLDKASISTREAEGQTKKLKSLNRSMFAVHVDNPFTKKKRETEFEQRTLDQHRADRDLRETTRKAGWEANAHMEAGFKEIEGSRSVNKWERASAAEKKKFQFEDDSEGDEAEDRIDDAMERTAGHVHTLNSVAKLMGKEIDAQNTVIDSVGNKATTLDDRAKLNTERLRRIR